MSDQKTSQKAEDRPAVKLSDLVFRDSAPLEDDERPSPLHWWLAGGRLNRNKASMGVPNGRELRERKAVESWNREYVGFWGTVAGVRKVKQTRSDLTKLCERIASTKAGETSDEDSSDSDSPDGKANARTDSSHTEKPAEAKPTGLVPEETELEDSKSSISMPEEGAEGPHEQPNSEEKNPEEPKSEAHKSVHWEDSIPGPPSVAEEPHDAAKATEATKTEKQGEAEQNDNPQIEIGGSAAEREAAQEGRNTEKQST